LEHLPGRRLLLAFRLRALLQRLLQLRDDRFEVRGLIGLDEVEHHAGVRREGACGGRCLRRWRGLRGCTLCGRSLSEHRGCRQCADNKSEGNPAKHRGLLYEKRKGVTLAYSVEQTPKNL